MNSKDVEEQFKDIVSHLGEPKTKRKYSFHRNEEETFYYTDEGYRFLKTASIYYIVVCAIGLALIVAGVPSQSVIIGVCGFLTALWGTVKFLGIREKYVSVRQYRTEGEKVAQQRTFNQ